VLVSGVTCGNAQTPWSSLSGEAALFRAALLGMKVEKLYGEGKFDAAIPLAEQNLSLTEKALGPLHPVVAASLNNLAALYHAQAAYAKAEPLLVRALAIHEKALGPLNLDVAASLNNLALLYQAQGAYAKAEPLLVRALAIHEKALGPLHPGVATSLNNLSMLYQAQGAYAKAEPLLVRALAIRENALGPLHPDVANSLNNLATLFQAQGAYAKAEPLLVRALAIRENALGPLHPDVAESLNDLAVIYWAQGAYIKAEPLVVRALHINERALGSLHPAVATSLNNLAMLYRDQGALAKAEPLLVRALAIDEKALGPLHPDVAAILGNLALLYQAQGAYAKAESLYLRALHIQEQALGPMHPDVATTLNNLAWFYRIQGAYAKAESLYLRALDIREQALGPMHPDVAASLNNLALLYRYQGAYAKAEPLYVRAADIRESQLRTELRRLSEVRKSALMEMLGRQTEAAVSFHVHDVPNSVRSLEFALTTVFRNKGRVLDSLADNQSALREHLTPKLLNQLDELTQARAELTALLYDVKIPTEGAERRKARRETADALRARIDDLESALSAASIEFRAQSEPVTVAKVQQALSPGSALVELMRYHRLDARDPSRRWKEERYVAYILPSSGPPQWVALGEEASIDAAVDAVLATVHQNSSAAEAKAALQRLHSLVMMPLAASLKDVSHLIIAPDAKLNLVPFEALVDAQGDYLLKRYLVSYVTTGRDLLRMANRRSPRSEATIVAAPDYGVGTRQPQFRDLSGAKAEITEVGTYFPQSKTLTSKAASKAALSKLHGPAVLHVATHGFYAQGGGGAGGSGAAAPIGSSTAPRVAAAARTRGMSIEGVESALAPLPEDGSGSVDATIDALDRAGLALAGANVGADGIMTAREIAGLDWWGTQLVVLSACETGVGAVASGEGVYGLRRALVLAGAEAQVVSLWNVTDSSARALMKEFYAELSRGRCRRRARDRTRA
jgi:CHAT domain-containing protein/Tfp pilus assembly protein PilF